MANNVLYAGAAAVDITPVPGTILGVDYVLHYARFIHDPLHAKAVVLRDNKMTLALVIVDICIMGTDFMDDVKARIEIETGIPSHHILLASNHNHASGNVVGLLGGAVDIEYRLKLPRLIVEAVRLALDNLRPASIASGSVEVPDFVVCRRYLMKEGYKAYNPVTRKLDQVKTNPIGSEQFIVGTAGKTDPGLGFLAIKGLDNSWIAMLGNYSLHYVGDWKDDTVTADYFGEFALQMREKLNAGADFVGIMSNGTSADINLWDFMHPDRFSPDEYAKTKLVGGTLAQKITDELNKVHWQTDVSLAVNFEEVELAVRKPSAEELRAATASFIHSDFDNLGLKSDMIQRIYDREQILLNEYPDTVKSPVQAFKIGNLVIGALGGEFFAETGLLLKAGISGFDYFSISLANAYGGYVPPAHEMERGGYETWRARSSFLEPGAEEKIRKTLIRLVQKFIKT